ncbi:PREDICTED: heat shock protein 67B2-like [Ceratosolen solmsi marchali]|uniref:Heat shock protein 67B2-like n=1 Tax=Ceratosolen solmsi marchali TaxID=326594 RepID=A0AAJ7DZH7_9HYME|nr:PREDICTED: heat shock protein 67B2-like [Ceratosolen solmsi marchali]
MFEEMIVANKSVISLLNSAYRFKVGQQLQTLPSFTKFLTPKDSHSCISINCYQQQNYITSLDKNMHCLINRNKTSILSKAMSEQSSENLHVNYYDIVKAQKDENILIIDVRENYEIEETGKLPGSVHIPMHEVTNSLLSLTNKEFEKKFNRQKPVHDTKIILSCKSGRRSAMTQLDVQKLGYKNVHNYLGGWLDWESHQKN